MFPNYQAEIVFHRFDEVEVNVDREYRVEQSICGNNHWIAFREEGYTLDDAKLVVDTLSRLGLPDKFRVVRPAKVVYEV